MKQVKDIMSRNVDFCHSDDNVYEAALKMKNDNVGAIPVCKDGKLIGMITDRDLAVRCIAEKRPGSTKVTDVMTTVLVTAEPDMKLEEAAALMSEKQIRRLPVLEEGKLVGMVSLGDLSLQRQSDIAVGHVLTDVSENREQIH